MATGFVDPGHRDVQGVQPATDRSARLVRQRPLRRRLIVVAPTMVEAVRSTGGWLFDQAMAGWDVLVLVPGGADSRPLRILGARPDDLASVLESPSRCPRPHALAVDAGLCGTDGRVLRQVRKLVETGRTDVRFWGDCWRADVDGEIGSSLHELSVAARAFKTQALAAADAPIEPIAATETFHSAALLSSVPDLIPAA